MWHLILDQYAESEYDDLDGADIQEIAVPCRRKPVILPNRRPEWLPRKQA